MSKNSPKINLRRKLYSQIILVIISMAIISLSAFYLMDAQYRNSFVENNIARSTAEAAEKMRSAIDPVSRSILAACDWGVSGLLNLERVENITLKFAPLLKQLSLLKSLTLVNDTGQFLFIERQHEGWRRWSGFTDDPEGVRDTRFDSVWTAIVQDRKIQSTSDRILNSIAHLQAQRQNQQIIWLSESYADNSVESHIYAISGWERDSASTVIAIEVNLNELVRLQAEISSGSRARVFLFDSSFVLMGGEGGGPARFVGYESVNDPAITDFLMKRNGEEDSGYMRFESQKNRWWGGAVSLYKKSGGIKIAVLSQERVLYANFHSRRAVIYIILTVALLISAAIIRFLFVRYGQNMDKIIGEMAKKNKVRENISEIIAGGEGTQVEFKSTIRKNLKTGKFGKEIEMAWLKSIAAYLNSEGGVLLIGVGDDGKILGLAQDEFENEDRCLLHFKNILNRHIGSEYSGYIKIRLQKIEGKQVAFVKVSPSLEPAFLKGKNDEEDFYIRSGPSSVKLSVRQSLKYIRSREKERKDSGQ